MPLYKPTMKVFVSFFLLTSFSGGFSRANSHACMDYYRFGKQSSQQRLSYAREVGFSVKIKDGRSSDVVFNVPEGTQSYLIEIHGKPDASYLISSLVNAKGHTTIRKSTPDSLKPSAKSELTTALQDIEGISDASDLIGPYLSPIRNQIGVSPGYSSELVHISKTVEVPAGQTHLRIRALRLTDDHEVSVRIVFKPIAPKKHISRLKLRLVDVEGLQIDPNSKTFQFLKQQLTAIFSQAKIEIELEHGPTLDKSFSEVKNDAEIARLLKNDPQPLDASVLKIFFIRSLQFSESFAAEGYSPGIPGPASTLARRDSGVIMTSYTVPRKTDHIDSHYAYAMQIGIGMAHEIGHYLGLSHTQELAFPILKDTHSDTTPGENLMDGQPPRSGTALVSSQQGAVLRAHPLVIQTPLK